MDWLECDDSWRIDEAESEHGGWFKLVNLFIYFTVRPFSRDISKAVSLRQVPLDGNTMIVQLKSAEKCHRKKYKLTVK